LQAFLACFLACDFLTLAVRQFAELESGHLQTLTFFSWFFLAPASSERRVMRVTAPMLAAANPRSVCNRVRRVVASHLMR